MQRLRLSPSKMVVWSQCQRHMQSVFMQQVPQTANIYSAIGTASHWVIEQINKGANWTPMQREEVLHQKLLAECAKDGVDIQFPKGYKESRDTIRDYSIPAGWVFLQGEQKHVLTLENFDFSYIIDALFTNEAGTDLYIVDYKTSSAAPSTQLQLHLYAWAEWKRKGVDPEAMTAYFWMLRRNEKIEVKIDTALVERIDKYMNMSVRLMYAMMEKEERFPATPGHCFFCPEPNCAERK